MRPKGFGYRGYHFADAPFNPRLQIYEPSGFRKYGIHHPLKQKSRQKPLWDQPLSKPRLELGAKIDAEFHPEFHQEFAAVLVHEFDMNGAGARMMDQGFL